MPANKQDYNNPQLPRSIKGGEGGGTHSQIKQKLLKLSANHAVKYHNAACALGRLLTVAKRPTSATGAAECSHCR